jgi:hypothetical protein
MTAKEKDDGKTHDFFILAGSALRTLFSWILGTCSITGTKKILLGLWGYREHSCLNCMSYGATRLTIKDECEGFIYSLFPMSKIASARLLLQE